MAWNQEFSFPPVQLAMPFMWAHYVDNDIYNSRVHRGDTTRHRKRMWANQGKSQNSVEESSAVKTQSQHLKEMKEKPREAT